MSGSFQTVEFIAQTRDGIAPAASQIKEFAEAVMQGQVTDAQLAAWTMAVYFRSLSPDALFALTWAMAESGELLDLSPIEGIKVDKHSTGGVGDKTTLVLAPLAASFGVPVIKLSGRALGHSGGTVDKLESIPGFRSELSREEIIAQGRRLGLVLASHYAKLAPLDAKIYQLRDSCATVESVPLIASSIMSKKLAGGADGFVFDVKVGPGAFMKTMAQAQELAGRLEELASRAGRGAKIIYSSMADPLGFAVGDALEVKEAVACLEGQGPEDLVELVLALCQAMLALANVKAEKSEILAKLNSGIAREKFAQMVASQGGRLTELPVAPARGPLLAGSSGFVNWDAKGVGMVARTLTGWRQEHPASGVEIIAKRGYAVSEGDLVAMIHAQNSAQLAWAKEALAGCLTLSCQAPEPIALLF